MMSPGTASQSVDGLLVLLDLLSRPEEAKTLLTQFKNLADSATNEQKRLMEEKIGYSNLLTTVGQQIEEVNRLIPQLRSVMDKASQVVADAEMSKITITNQTMAMVREADKTLADIAARADGIVELLDSEISQREARVISLEKSADAAEARLKAAEAKLNELRANL